LNSTVLTILAAAAATYATRAGGYFVLARMRRVPPRLQAALEAVPAAVLTAIVAPALVQGGWPELAALGVAALLSLRTGMTAMFIGGAATLILLRMVAGAL
jgi:uncharacterized membrane protein